MVNGFQDAIGNLFENWLQDHPPIHWMIDHPLWTLVMVAIAIFVFWGLLKAIAHVIEQLWLLLLQFPLRLLQWLGMALVQGFQQVMTAKEVPEEVLMESCPLTKEEQLSQLLTRLEGMQQEQADLFQEIKKLLKPAP